MTCVQSAVEIGKRGMHLIACVKTANALYPQAFIDKALKPLPAGSQIVLTSSDGGVELMAIGYKYNRKKVLFFVATRGAGITTPGQPYQQRFSDVHGNLVTREISRPAVVSDYFGVSPRVDNHNQSRQDDLALEELWQTHDCWFRLHCTFQGVLATDCWKACRMHCAQGHPLQGTSMGDFADYLVVALLNNNLSESALPTRKTGRKRGFGTDITNTGPSLDLATHTMASCGRNGKKTKQVRCRWCSVKEDRESYTSYHCVECGFGLCGPNNRHGRKCWLLHVTCSLQELRSVLARHRD